MRRGSFELSATMHARVGEVLAVLGPNGAGKTTLLRAVAGLAALDAGRITLDSDVFDDPAGRIFMAAQQRALGVVFQDHRLFGHLRVLGNVAFGQRSRGVAKAPATAAALAWLERLGIGELAQRRPAQLSGGQAQRVALARALACDPRALLLDEPLAALDVQTRAQVQGELREHLAGFAGPTLLVTHDPIEAVLLADRIVVLEQGRVVQHGTPTQITTMPLTPYVARLVGANLYPGTFDGARVRLGGGVDLPGVELAVAAPGVPPGPVLAAVRAADVRVHGAQPTDVPPTGPPPVAWPGTVVGLAPLGDRIRLTVRGALDTDVDVDAATVAGVELARGRPVWLSVDPRDVRMYRAALAG